MLFIFLLLTGSLALSPIKRFDYCLTSCLYEKYFYRLGSEYDTICQQCFDSAKNEVKNYEEAQWVDFLSLLWEEQRYNEKYIKSKDEHTKSKLIKSFNDIISIINNKTKQCFIESKWIEWIEYFLSHSRNNYVYDSIVYNWQKNVKVSLNKSNQICLNRKWIFSL